ncbi:hypothetical protein [Candidatus Villigracilis affinis]|uniref:hypothetical protein n=1 Tax=Candidatus Villigracilis affinis TaxID=3140682 RepID=UPI001D444973|nr:hypothetical protein [Anaerolineales bacterium]
MGLRGVPRREISQQEEPPSGSTPIGTGDYRGLLATADGLAVVDLSVRDPSVAAKAGSGTLLSVAGTLTFDGKVVGVTGSLDGTTATVTGGGYSLTGTLGDGVLDLTMTGPSGTSSFSVFTGGSTITLHCGLYEGAKKADRRRDRGQPRGRRDRAGRGRQGP